MIKPWMFEFFRAPVDDDVLIPAPVDGVTATEVAAHFADFWQRWLMAEGLGYEGIFFSEHHFGPGYSPAPNLLIAALAPMTKTLRLGVMGVVLPYSSPWRVIEQIGMLDQLTQGRLEVGTASGIPPEMAQVGLGVAEAGERNAEAQEILDWALTHPGERLTHHGKYWSFENLAFVPLPLQQPPPRWTTVVSEASARRAAARGTKICTGFSSVDRVTEVFDAYREDAAQAGFEVSSDLLGLRRNVIVCEDGERARDLAARQAEQVLAMFKHAQDAVNHGPVPDAPQQSRGDSPIHDDEFVAGTPAEVAEQIIDQCRTTGAGHFLVMLDAHGGLAANQEAFELFGREIIPVLRSAAPVGEVAAHASGGTA